MTAHYSLTIFSKDPVDSNSSSESQMFATTRELIQKYRDAPFNSTVIQSSTSKFFEESPSSQELKKVAPTRKSKKTNKK